MLITEGQVSLERTQTSHDGSVPLTRLLWPSFVTDQPDLYIHLEEVSAGRIMCTLIRTEQGFQGDVWSLCWPRPIEVLTDWLTDVRTVTDPKTRLFLRWSTTRRWEKKWLDDYEKHCDEKSKRRKRRSRDLEKQRVETRKLNCLISPTTPHSASRSRKSTSRKKTNSSSKTGRSSSRAPASAEGVLVTVATLALTTAAVAATASAK